MEYEECLPKYPIPLFINIMTFTVRQVTNGSTGSNGLKTNHNEGIWYIMAQV